MKKRYEAHDGTAGTEQALFAVRGAGDSFPETESPEKGEGKQQ